MAELCLRGKMCEVFVSCIPIAYLAVPVPAGLVLGMGESETGTSSPKFSQTGDLHRCRVTWSLLGA